LQTIKRKSTNVLLLFRILAHYAYAEPQVSTVILIINVKKNNCLSIMITATDQKLIENELFSLARLVAVN